MDKRILLCIDANFSPATQSMVRAVGELVQQTDTTFSLILLHTIPITQIIADQTGYYLEQQLMLTPSYEQRKQGEAALHKARTDLQHYGIMPEHIEEIICVGTITEKIVQVARERHVQLIAIGSRGMAFRNQIRRLFLGSISRRILQLAPCPVMVAVASQPRQGKELISWYEDTLKGYLKEHKHTLTILTPQQAAKQFLPSDKMTPGRQEIHAATKALDHLVNMGLLCRRDVAGEVHYIND